MKFLKKKYTALCIARPISIAFVFLPIMSIELGHSNFSSTLSVARDGGLPYLDFLLGRNPLIWSNDLSFSQKSSFNLIYKDTRRQSTLLHSILDFSICLLTAALAQSTTKHGKRLHTSDPRIM